MTVRGARVLFLTESFHPVLGGGERHIRLLASRLAASGMPATVVTRRTEPGWPRDESLDGIRVIRVPPPGPARAGKYLMVPAALVALRRLRRSYDLVVVRGTRVLGLPGLLSARALGKRVVLQAEVNGEMTGEVYTWGTPFQRQPLRSAVHGLVRLRNLTLTDADAFVAMSRQIQDEFLGAGVAPERVAHIPHGVDTGRFRPVTLEEKAALRRRLGLSLPLALADDALVVTYTGRLLRGKGLEALLDAFGRVAARQATARLLLVGSGSGQSLSVEAELRERALAAGLGQRVVFAGRVDDVEAHLQASDVFAFPSVFEALGLSLIEAAACGLPAVASRTGGIVDVVEDGVSGTLVEPGDVSGLAAALEALLADPGRRVALGRRARAIARHRFDLDDNVGRYRALFQEVAGRLR